MLDLATGTGAVAIRAARTGADGDRLDLAEPMLAKARDGAEEAGVDDRFDLGNVEYLPYDDACVRRRRLELRRSSSPRTTRTSPTSSRA